MTRRSPASLFLLALLGVSAATGVVLRAGTLSSRYQAEVTRLRAEWSAAAKSEGFDPRNGAKRLFEAHPTPEITLARPVTIAPGRSGPVSLAGKFRPTTVFLAEHDGVTLSGGKVAGTTFTATATVAADALPGFARVFAYTPVSGAWDAAGIVVIGTAPAFSLTASNGWTIRLTPDKTGWTVNDQEATLVYRAEYFKPGASTPFETMTGPLRVSGQEQPGTAFTFSLQPGNAGTAMAEYQALMAKMADPASFAKMSARERAIFDKKMEEVGDRMTKELEAMTADPAAMVARQANFGCGSISLELGGPQISGYVGCGQQVGNLKLVGTRM